jgi:hypothetical protein
MSFHGFPAFLIVAGTFNTLKSFDMMDDNSFHRIGIDTVAVGLAIVQYIAYNFSEPPDLIICI